MATTTSSPFLAERTDIHKSCKSLETLLTLLNDYCEAVGVIGQLQKKLAKALRETAAMKITGEIAANAMNTSAVIFEVSAEIDAKFARFADKEYDNISGEVKKWFKKLAKEEKAHDDKLSNANAKIKQAGQLYEKKSKKNARDATEEHARYINLISTLGPEISQEKYNHALNVTQRHTSTTNSTAACLSRIADAEWLRACESIRKYSPSVGPLGEWRALCEGNWEGPAPKDLPDVGDSQRPETDDIDHIGRREEERSSPMAWKNPEGGVSRESVNLNSPAQGSGEQTGNRQPHNQLSPPQSSAPNMSKANLSQSPSMPRYDVPTLSTAPSAYDRPFVDNSGSVRTLSAFPAPPTHFPLPSPRQQTSQSHASLKSSSSNANISGRRAESPLPMSDAPSNEAVKQVGNDPPMTPSFERPQSVSQTQQTSPLNVATPRPINATAEWANNIPLVRPMNLNADAKSTNDPPAYEQGRYSDQEFGVRSRALGNVRAQTLERSDTAGSGGSVVAAMRSRYTSTPRTTSPTLKDIPTLPLSVNDLASRYQSPESPTSSRARTSSTSHSRQSPVLERHSDRGTSPTTPRYGLSTSTGSNPAISTIQEHEHPMSHHERERPNETATLDIKRKEQELLEREWMIERQARELERDRAQLANAQATDELAEAADRFRLAAGLSSGSQQPLHRPRERRTSLRQLQEQQPQSQVDVRYGSPPMPTTPNRPQSQYSAGASPSHLVPSSAPQRAYSNDGQALSSAQSQYSYTSSSSQQSSAHAPYCGCETCSVAKYRQSSKNNNDASHEDDGDPQPLTTPVALRTRKHSEKSKPGWIRRLSMPVVGNAFNLDLKKGGIGSPTHASKGGLLSMDGRKNASNTMLHAASDAGRKSFETGGISNRSMTHLGGR